MSLIVKGLGWFFLCMLWHSEAQLPYGNVHFVDESLETRNLLFRGSNPVVNGTFQYDLLVGSLKQAAANAGVNFPSQFTLIDISFLTVAHMPAPIGDIDREATIAEYSFFQQNSHLGKYLYWQVKSVILLKLMGFLKSFLLPLCLTGRSLFSYTYSRLADGLISRVDVLWSLLQTRNTLPQIIYGHCDGGTDRTGEIFGAYYIRHKGMTWQQVHTLNRKFSNRVQVCQNQLALQWYCLWHSQVYNGPPDCDLQLPCLPLQCHYDFK